MDKLETLGERMEFARRRRLWTQQELAANAELSLLTVNRIENGRGTQTPRYSTIRRIARALTVDPRWLLSGEGESGIDEGKAAA